MPSPFQMPLRTLQRLPGSGFSTGDEISSGMGANDALNVRSLQGQRQNEAQENLFRAVRSGDRNEALALKGLIGELGGEMESSPLARDMGFANDAMKANEAARRQGFDTSAAAARYGRTQDERKLNQPMELQKLEGQQALERQAAGIEGQRSLQSDRAGQTQDLYKFLGTAGGNGIKSVSPSTGGVTFQSPSRAGGTGASKIPPAVLTQLAKARQAYSSMGEPGALGSFFGGGNRRNAAKAQLDQLVSSAVMSHPANNGLKTLAHDIANDPEASQLPLEQLLSEVGGDGMGPDEIDDLRDLLGLYTGRTY